MKKTILAGWMLLAATVAHAEGGAPWSYSGATGPQEWSKLSPDYAACDGKNQSPIDVKGLIPAQLTPIKFKYQSGGNEMVNNGHTIQVNYQPGSPITVDGVQFEVKQFHFHAPSENTIDGKSYPMELHIVHADKAGNLAVIGVLFEEGAKNKALEKIWPLMPQEKDQKVALEPVFSVASLLPSNKAYYRFNGSLTTPPCSEGVRWLLMKAPLKASKEQLLAFEKTIHHPNNRPVQMVNARPVLK